MPTMTNSSPALPVGGFRPRLWTPGDWNAFFGFGTNILVNMLVLTALLRFVLKMPDAITFGRILPAVGLMLFLSTAYYAWLAYRLAKETGRDDVCALPSGISVPHMFIVVFVIMLPIGLQTGDPVKAWEAGLAWVFIQSFILMAGGFVAPLIRRVTPRAALLGTLAGVSITFIAMRPALEMYMTPLLGLTCFGIIIVSWLGRLPRYPRNLPAGLVAIAFGVVVAWLSAAIGLGIGGMSGSKLVAGLSNIGFSVPIPCGGPRLLGFRVPRHHPGHRDSVRHLRPRRGDGQCSRARKRQAMPIRPRACLPRTEPVSLIGCLMGNPFINAVYIGHPGWKAMGGRIGYSFVTGLTVLALSWLGLVSLLLDVVPVVAIAPILLYIGMLIGAQAFEETPKSHAPAVVLALTPHLAAWAKTLIDGALGAAGTSAAAIGMDKLASVGVLYPGLAVMGEGAILSGLVLAAVAVFVIERDLTRRRRSRRPERC